MHRGGVRNMGEPARSSESSASQSKEIIPKSTSKNSTWKAGAHSGIRFNGNVKKETVVKPFSFATRSTAGKKNPVVLPGKENGENKDKKNIPETKAEQARKCTIVSKEIPRGVAARNSNIPVLSKSTKGVKNGSTSSLDAVKPATSTTTNPRRILAAHSGLRFHGKPRKETKMKPFSFQQRSEPKQVPENAVEEI